MTTKVIFLDIDGPMIPATQLLVDSLASWKRVFPATTLAVLREMCERTEAKIVFNTTHNRPFEGVDDIDVALEKQGIDRDFIHPTDLATKYPEIPRDLAVTEWLQRHPEVENWVALDDVKFTEDTRLLWVNPAAGLDFDHLNQAIEILGGGPCLMLM